MNLKISVLRVKKDKIPALFHISPLLITFEENPIHARKDIRAVHYRKTG